MEVDTGASVTVISEAMLGSIWPTQPAPPLHPTDVKLRTYTGEAIPVMRRLLVKVRYQGQEEQLPLSVVVGDGSSLLGRDWLAKLKLEWKHTFNVHAQESLQDVMKQHNTVFKPELGRIQRVEAKLHVNLEAPTWGGPYQPWRKANADYAGPLLGHMFLILIDAHSKWMEVHMTKSSTLLMTIEKMRSTFATLGLPEQLVADNGPSFTSEEFQQFMRNNRVHHIMTSPYHPSSNGLAERAVQTFK